VGECITLEAQDAWRCCCEAAAKLGCLV